MQDMLTYPGGSLLVCLDVNTYIAGDIEAAARANGFGCEGKSDLQSGEDGFTGISHRLAEVVLVGDSTPPFYHKP